MLGIVHDGKKILNNVKTVLLELWIGNFESNFGFFERLFGVSRTFPMDGSLAMRSRTASIIIFHSQVRAVV